MKIHSDVFIAGRIFKDWISKRKLFGSQRDSLLCVVNGSNHDAAHSIVLPLNNEITVHYYKLPIQKPFFQTVAQWVSFRELHHFQMHQFWSIFRSLANTILNFHAKTNGFFPIFKFSRSKWPKSANALCIFWWSFGAKIQLEMNVIK